MEPNRNNHKGGVASLSHANNDQSVKTQAFEFVNTKEQTKDSNKRSLRAISLAVVSSMLLGSPLAITPAAAEPNANVLRLFEYSNQDPASMCFSMTKKQSVLNDTNNLNSFVEVRDLGPSLKLSEAERADIRMRGRTNLSKEENDRLAKSYASLYNKGKAIDSRPNIDNDRLCVTNLKHGNSYVLTLKKGLQFKSGESLNESVNVPFSITDSLAQINLPRNNILPKNRTNNVITLRTVNQPAFRVSVYRVPSLVLGSYGVSGYAALADDSAYPTVDIAKNNGVMVLDRLYDLENNNVTSLDDLGNSDNKTEEINKVLQKASKLRLDADKLNNPILTEIKVGDFVKENDGGIYLIVLRDPRSGADLKYDYAFTPSGILAAKGLIISDIGVSTYMSDEGFLVNTRSFTTAKTLPDLKVSIYAKNGDLLGEAKTDSNGVVRFDKSVISGTDALTPTGLLVQGNDDSFFQSLQETPLYIEANTGASNHTGYATFAYTDRGIYRSGETVHYTALVRDNSLNAVNLPLTLQVLNPSGAEITKTLLDKAQAGGYEFDFTLPKGISNGAYKAILKLGKKVLDTTVFNVGAYVPTQINSELTNNETLLPINAAFKLKSKTNFNYGGAASNLSGSFNVTLIPDENPVPSSANAAGNPNLKYYHFGPDIRKLTSLIQNNNYGNIKTDVLGVLQQDVTLKPADFPQIAKISSSVFDPNGQEVKASKQIKVAFNSPLIGIMPIQSNGSPINTSSSGSGERQETSLITSSDDIGFSLCSYLQDGSTYPQDVKYYIYNEIVDYNFVYRNGRWDYVRYVSRTPVTQGSVRVDNQNLNNALFSANLPDGRYVIELESPKSKTTYAFTKGFTSAIDANTPDRVQLFADKTEYNVGDKAKLSFESPFDGTANLALGSTGISDFKTFDIKKGHNEITVDITDKFEPQGHALLSIFSPQNTDKVGASRAVGIVDLNLNHANNKLNVKLDVPSEIKPNTTLDVKIQAIGQNEANAAANAANGANSGDGNNGGANGGDGNNAAQAGDNNNQAPANGNTRYVKVTLVDTGILDLTGYKAPNPNNKLLQDRKYDVNLLDAYSYIMNDPRQQGQGYDENAKLAGASLPGLDAMPYKVVALASKIVALDANGNGDVKFDVPQFSGRLKVMAVAWDNNKTGSADNNVLIRDNAVATIGLPRYLNVNDEVVASLNLHNLKASNPQFIYDVSCSGAIQCSLQGTSNLKPGIREDKPFTITATSEGIGEINLKVINPDFNVTDNYKLAVTLPTLPIVKSYTKLVKANESLTLPIKSDFNKIDYLMAATSSLPNVNPKAFLYDLNDAGNYSLNDLIANLESKLLYGSLLVKQDNNVTASNNADTGSANNASNNVDPKSNPEASAADGSSDTAKQDEANKSGVSKDTDASVVIAVGTGANSKEAAANAKLAADAAAQDDSSVTANSDTPYASEADLNRAINELIVRILSRQNKTQGFSSNAFTNIYATKVLLMADKLGYQVNADALNEAISNIRNYSSQYSTDNGAFANAVLSQYENVDLATLRQAAFMAQRKQIKAPITLANLADALYNAGDTERARNVILNAITSLKAWSDLEDKLSKTKGDIDAVLDLLSDINSYNVFRATDLRHDAFVVINSLIKQGMFNEVSDLISSLHVLTDSPDYLSALSMAAMLEANSKLDGTAKALSLNVGDADSSKNVNPNSFGSAILDKNTINALLEGKDGASIKASGSGSLLDKLSIQNGGITYQNGDSNTYLTVSAVGNMKRENVISDRGIEVNINYYSTSGDFFDPAQYSLVKNEEILMEVIYNNSLNTNSDELLKVKLPAGFEFVRYADSQDPTFSTLMQEAQITYPYSIQNSDDMVYATFGRGHDSVSLYIVLRAAQSGTFSQGEALMQLVSSPEFYGSYINNSKFTIKSQDK